MNISHDRNTREFLRKPLIAIAVLACFSIGGFFLVAQTKHAAICSLMVTLLAVLLAASVIVSRSRRGLDEVRTRIQAQAALQTNAEDYRSSFENAVEGIYRTTPQGRLLRANPALARMAGYASPEEMIACSTSLQDQCYVDPSDREVFLRECTEKGEVRGFVFQHRRKDGTVFWASNNARAVKDDQETPSTMKGLSKTSPNGNRNANPC